MDAECVFDGILRDPQDFSQFLLNSSFNNFTIEMRQRLAQSIGIDRVFIQLYRETRRIATSYYISLHRQLMSYLGMNVSLYDVQPDGNCLYRALSHIIFGGEDHYELLKHKLIQTFLASPIYTLMLCKNPVSLVNRNCGNMLIRYLHEMPGVLMSNFPC